MGVKFNPWGLVQKQAPASEIDKELKKAREFYLTKRKLNLGCNVDIRGDFCNIDILDPEPVDDKPHEIDVLWDIKQLDQLCPEESADEILAYDLLEHFPFSKTKQILTDWVRILKPGGTIIIRTPDMEKLARTLINETIPTFEIQRLIYGGQDYPYNFHMAGFTGDLLEGYLLGCGCTSILQIVREDDTYNVTVVARK